MSKATLTEGEMRVLALAWHCFETQPKVNTTKLAELGGYKTPASANAVFSAARKKMLESSTTEPTSTTPKSTGKKRGASDTPGEGTATKKKRARKSRAETQAVATTENDGDDDESKVKSEADGDDAAEQVLNGAQEFLDAKVEEKAKSTEDA